MNIKNVIALIPILLIGIFVSGQTIKIDMNRMAKDDAFEKSQSILPVYKYTSDSIQPYSKFGLEADESKPWYQIKKMPDMGSCRDTGYTYIYFAGSDNAESQGYLLTIIGNYKRSRRTVYFFIDRNNDFDFSNDGSPDSITWKQHHFEVKLENSTVPGAMYGLKLTRFKYGENVRYKNLLTEHYKAHSGKKEFTNINYCFREQRYNSIIGNYRNGLDSFSIGIKDMNVNGIYNESCTDLFYVGPYESQLNSDKLFNITPTINNTVFEWGGKKYRVKSIETTGKYIELKKDSSAILSNKLEIGKRTPNFTYFNVFNKEHQLKDFKKQEIFLFFWDLDSQSEEDTAYISKINADYEKKIKVITLNHGDKSKDVKISYYYDKISYPVGYSNSEIADSYFVEDVPLGFYLGKKCVLIDDRISPKEMYQLLQDKYN
mgnify:FL=1